MGSCDAETLPTPRKRLEPVWGKEAGDSARSGCWGLCDPMPLLSISVHWHGKPLGRLSQDAARWERGQVTAWGRTHGHSGEAAEGAEAAGTARAGVRVET